MDEIYYERNGEIFRKSVLIARFGEEGLEEAIKKFGFKEVDNPKKKEERLDSNAAFYYERNGEEFSRDVLEAKFGDKTDEAVKKLGFKEVIKPQTWSQNITDNDNYNAKDHFIDRRDPVKKKEEPFSTSPKESSASPFTSAEDKSLLESYATDLKKKRKGVKENSDGTESTHKMAYAEEDGKFVAYPTIFQDEDGEYYEPDTKKDKWAALKEAKKKGETYTFENEEQAKAFAEGAWKDKGEKSNPKPVQKPLPRVEGRQKFTDKTAKINEDDHWWEQIKGGYSINKLRELATGSTRLGEAISGYPAAVYRLFAAPQNAIADLTGLDIKATPEKFSEVTGINNKVLEYYEQETLKLSAETDNYYRNKYGTDADGNTERSPYDAFKKGEYERFWEQLGGMMNESMPISVAMMAGGAAVGVSKLALYGTPAFVESSMNDLKKADPEAFAIMSETEKTVKAYGMAGAETVFASLTQGTLGKVYKDIITKEGVDAGKVIFKEGIVKLLETALKKYGAPVGAMMEGIEEVATTVTQNIIAGRPAHLNVADSFLSGLATGGVFSAPINAMQAQEKVLNNIEKNKVNRTIENSNYGDLTEAFKKADEDNIDDVQLTVAGNTTSRKTLETDLKKQVEEGKITQEESDQAMRVFNITGNLLKATEGLDLTEEQKIKAINLLKKKVVLGEKIKDKDPNLVRKEIEELGKIDEELAKIRGEEQDEGFQFKGVPRAAAEKLFDLDRQSKRNIDARREIYGNEKLSEDEKDAKLEQLHLKADEIYNEYRKAAIEAYKSLPKKEREQYRKAAKDKIKKDDGTTQLVAESLEELLMKPFRGKNSQSSIDSQARRDFEKDILKSKRDYDIDNKVGFKFEAFETEDGNNVEFLDGTGNLYIDPAFWQGKVQDGISKEFWESPERIEEYKGNLEQQLEQEKKDRQEDDGANYDHIEEAIKILDNRLEELKSEKPSEETTANPDVDLNSLVDKARQGDIEAQKKIESYGLKWEKEPITRFVGQSEVDALLNGEKIEGKNKNYGVDVTKDVEGKKVPATNSDYRINFKEEGFDDKKEGSRITMKNEQDGWIPGGYTLEDVQSIEKWNNDGTWETIYDAKEGNKDKSKSDTETETDVEGKPDQDAETLVWDEEKGEATYNENGFKLTVKREHSEKSGENWIIVTGNLKGGKVVDRVFTSEQLEDAINFGKEKIKEHSPIKKEPKKKPKAAPAVDANPNPETQVIKTTEKGKEWTVTRTETGLDIRDKDGKEPSAPTMRKIRDIYAEKFDYTYGKLAGEVTEQSREEDTMAFVAENSQNPAEVAEVLINNKLENILEEEADYDEFMIASVIGYVKKSSFIENGDRNYITNGLARSYFRPDGEPIDIIAINASSEAGHEISIQQVIDFMVKYPNGAEELARSIKNEKIVPLQKKFTELTGLPAIDKYFDQAIEQVKQREIRDSYLTSLDVMSNEELQQLAEEREKSFEEFIENNYVVKEKNKPGNEKSTKTKGGKKDGSRSRVRKKNPGKTKAKKPKGSVKETFTKLNPDGERVINLDAVKEKLPLAYAEFKKYRDAEKFHNGYTRGLTTEFYSKAYSSKHWQKKTLELLKELEQVKKEFDQFDPQPAISKAEFKKALKKSGDFNADQLKIYNALIDNLTTDLLPGYILNDKQAYKLGVRGTNYYVPSMNMIRSKEPDAFIHEIGHWAFEQILTPEDRIAFVEYMNTKLAQHGKNWLKENLAYTAKRNLYTKDGKDYERTSNVANDINEYFAEQFRQWYVGNKTTSKEVDTIFQRLAEFLKEFIERIKSGNYIDQDLVPFFEKVIRAEKPKKADRKTAQQTLIEIAQNSDKETFLNGVHRVPLDGLDPKFPEDVKQKVLARKSRTPNQPVIVGFDDKGKARILDGAHRYYEAVERGDTTIDVRFTINEGEEKFWDKSQQQKNTDQNSEHRREPHLVTERMKPEVRKQKQPLRKVPDVLKDLVDALKITLKYRRSGGKYTLGTYHPRTALVSIRNRGDFGTVAHEVGHYLDDRFDISGTVPFGIQSQVDASIRWFYDRGGSNPPSRANKAQKEAYLKREGMAEFVRAYVVNPKLAKIKAPQLYDHFESVVDDKVIDALQQFSEEYLDHHNATNMEKVSSNVASTKLKGKDGFGEWFKGFKKQNGYGMTWMDNLKTEVANSLIPANKAFEYMLALSGETVTNKDNFEMISRTFKGINQKINTILSQGLINGQNQFLKAEGGTFKRDKNGQIIDPDKGTRVDLNWLVEPLNDVDSKTLMEEMDLTAALMIAQRTIEYAKKFGRFENLTGISSTDKSDIEVAMGFLNEFNELKESNPEKAERLLEASKRYRQYADWVLQYALEKGRLSQESYDKIKEGNQFYVALTRVKEEAPAEEVVNDLVKNAIGGGLSDAKNVIKRARGGSDFIQNPYTSLLYNTASIIREADRNEVMQTFIDPIRKSTRSMGEGDQVNFAAVAYPSSMAYDQEKGYMMPRDKNARAIYFDGEVEWWTLDQQVYDALTDSGLPSTVLQKIGTFLPTVIRNSVTHFPVFAVRNLTRDTFARLIISRTNSGLKDMIHNATDQENFDIFGASQSGFYLTDKDAYLGLMGETIKNRTKNTMIPLDPRLLGKGYMKMLEKGENINRIAEFKKAYRKARKEGLSDYEAGLYAAYQARDLMDFAVAGHTVRTLNRYIPFLNAGVQGLRRSWKGAKNNPAAFAGKMIAYTVLPTILAQVMASVFDYEDEYEQLPAYQRDLYWNYKFPGMEGFITIPKPFELGFFSSVVDRTISYTVRGNDLAFEGLDNSFTHSFIPFSEYSYMEFAGMKPLLETDFNKNSFTGNDIVPFWEEGLYVEDREGTKYASRISQKISDGFGMVGAEVDPRKVDHIFEGYGTYFAGMMLALTDAGKKETRHRLDLSKIGFYKAPPIANAMSVTKVTDLAQKLGYRSDKRVQKIRDYIDAYYVSEDKAERKRIMKKLYKFSEQTRLQMEKEAQDKLTNKKSNKVVRRRKK